jgi:ATP-binding cassette subfamily B protein
MRFLKRRIAFHYERQQQTSDRFLGMLSDVFRHHETIRINNAVHAFMERLGAIGKERAEAGKRNAVFNTVLASVYDNIVNVGTALLLLLIGSKMRTGAFSIGSFTLFIYFLGYVSGMIRLIGTTAAGFRKTESALSRIRELLGDDHVRQLANNDSLYLKQEPPSIDVPERKEPMKQLEVRNLICTFQGTAPGIRDISFTMPRTSFTVITGPIGSGKSTLLRAMLGLLPIDSGELVWNGRVVEAPAQFFVPPAAGYVPQVPALFSGTLRDNILLGYPDDNGRLQEALRVSTLDDDVIRFPDGLDTQLGPKGTALSGGQRQRVAIARMAARQAELWVLDDSSSALDAETELRMWERIDKLRKSAGVTCIVVSTKHFALKYADQVIVLDNGRIDASASRLLV